MYYINSQQGMIYLTFGTFVAAGMVTSIVAEINPYAPILPNLKRATVLFGVATMLAWFYA